MRALLILLGKLARAGLGGIWGFFIENPWRFGALALGLVYVWQAHLVTHTRAQRDEARAALAEEQKARLADRASWQQASELSGRLWEAALTQQRLQFQQEKEKADEKAQQMVAGYAARADDYARRMRFAALCPAAGGATGQSSGAEQGHAAQGADRPGADAVILSRADFDILSDNTRRLKAAHDWAVEVGQ